MIKKLKVHTVPMKFHDKLMLHTNNRSVNKQIWVNNYFDNVVIKIIKCNEVPLEIKYKLDTFLRLKGGNVCYSY